MIRREIAVFILPMLQTADEFLEMPVGEIHGADLAEEWADKLVDVSLVVFIRSK